MLFEDMFQSLISNLDFPSHTLFCGECHILLYIEYSERFNLAKVPSLYFYYRILIDRIYELSS